MTNKTNPKILLTVSLLLAATVCATTKAKTIYVDADATGSNNGSSWDDAYNYLQDALADADSSTKPVEILVAQGTYKPDQGGGQTPGDRTTTFQLISDVTIYGGFPSGGGPWETRDPNMYETTLSGDLSGNDVDVNDPCDLLTEPTRAENSYHVATGVSTDANAVLDGFIITAGNADGSSYPHQYGGGIFNNEYSQATISNCEFIRNSAELGGGAIVADVNSSLALTNCILNFNWGFDGGGILNNGTSLTVIHCAFLSNGSILGGGMQNYLSTCCTVTKCEFINNSAKTYGGGILNSGSNNLNISNCIFSKNVSSYGAAVFNLDSKKIKITDCNFANNTAENSAGGIYNTRSSPVLNDCNFIENRAEYAGAMYNWDSSNPSIHNCDFINNIASTAVGGMLNSDSSCPLMIDCNFMYNSGTSIYNRMSSPTITGCTFSGTRGMYNYSSDPVLDECTFRNNSGIGMQNEHSKPLLTECSFIGNSGGGIYDHNSSPVLKSCNFIENADFSGGGMYNDSYSCPELVKCNFSNNEARGGSGGGILNVRYSSPNLTDCIFTGNWAGNQGGAICNRNASNPLLRNCAFIANRAYNSGGGIHNYYSSPTVLYCTFNENTVLTPEIEFPYGCGGGVCNDRSYPDFIGCRFVENKVWNEGGGVYDNFSHPWYINCEFIGNQAPSIRGGGVSIRWDGHGTHFLNCTFYGNWCALSGGGINSWGRTPEIFNCIFWLNLDMNGYSEDSQVYVWNGDPNIYYSCVQGWSGSWGGSGNTGAEPNFADANGSDGVRGTIDDNLRLSSGSPCIDGGNNYGVPADYVDLDNDGNTSEQIPWDLDGFERFTDDICTTDTGSGTAPIVDMGAHEFLRSDIDSTGYVNLADFCLIGAYWKIVNCGTCEGADLTCDGNVDNNDLAQFVTYWLEGFRP